jgi:hypothetical protein
MLRSPKHGALKRLTRSMTATTAIHDGGRGRDFRGQRKQHVELREHGTASASSTAGSDNAARVENPRCHQAIVSQPSLHHGRTACR